MSYFKMRNSQPITRPIVIWVPVVQLVVSVLGCALGMLIAKNIGWAILLGGFISIVGQSYYNIRALKHFGNVNAGLVVAATYRAMWGKWLVIIALSLIAITQFNELNAGVFLGSLFFVYTLGAFLLPILVKRVANKPTIKS